MIEMDIDSNRVSLMNYQRVVILKEKASHRYLPIWIGPAEAESIAIKLQGVFVPRPLTHDLIGGIISQLGATVSAVVVSDLTNDTFFAKIVLNHDGRQIEVDSRPSDAIAIAVRARVPIYADEGVLDRAGVLIDKETGKPVERERAPDAVREVSAEELRGLSAFKDFVEELNLEDLGETSRE
ncbi:MAG: bifunctional nuclease family protein [Chloroflexi bacterium]|nr:bifunctional nuclease family protein [Chloroflexota bacterium]